MEMGKATQNIETKKLDNLRDFGGLWTVDGREILPHCLLRSARLYKLPDADVELLEDLGVSHVIDLRLEQEAAQQPDTDLSGAVNSIIPLREDYVKLQQGEVDKKHGLKKLAQSIPTMAYVYKTMVTYDYSLESLRQIFHIIFTESAPENAVLFHCTEGKDRTGVVAALALKLLGVDDSVIFDDYMRSNEPFEKRNRRYYIISGLAFRDFKYAREFQDLYKANLYMLTDMLDLVEKQYGGVEPFFTDTLGFDREEIDAWKERVTK